MMIDERETLRFDWLSLCSSSTSTPSSFQIHLHFYHLTITPALMRPWIYKNTSHKCYEIEGICVLIKALCVSSPQGFSFMNDWNSGVKFKAYTPPSLFQNSAERWLVSAGACLCLNISAFTDRRDVVRDLVSWSAAWRASQRLTERETRKHWTSALQDW